MRKKFLVIVVFFYVAVIAGSQLHAQNSVVQEGEFGFGVGAGHYFGDLNTKARLNRAKQNQDIIADITAK